MTTSEVPVIHDLTFFIVCYEDDMTVTILSKLLSP